MEEIVHYVALDWRQTQPTSQIIYFMNSMKNDSYNQDPSSLLCVTQMKFEYFIYKKVRY